MQVTFCLCFKAKCNSHLFLLFLSAVPLKPSKWVHTHWSGERATLTLTHLNKEDEGMYTLRVNTKSGFDSYSAYVFVKGIVPKFIAWKCYGKIKVQPLNRDNFVRVTNIKNNCLMSALNNTQTQAIEMWQICLVFFWSFLSLSWFNYRKSGYNE